MQDPLEVGAAIGAVPVPRSDGPPEDASIPSQQVGHREAANHKGPGCGSTGVQHGRKCEVKLLEESLDLIPGFFEVHRHYR